jgi:hypothetical protein
MGPVRTLIAGGVPPIKPNPSGLPGGAQLERLLSGLMFWTLLAAVAGVLVSAIVWALSSHSGNYQYAASGKRGALIAGAAALLAGAAVTLINFFYSVGSSI